jgi:hypothetical protein
MARRIPLRRLCTPVITSSYGRTVSFGNRAREDDGAVGSERDSHSATAGSRALLPPGIILLGVLMAAPACAVEDVPLNAGAVPAATGKGGATGADDTGVGGSPVSEGSGGSPGAVATALTMDDTCYVPLESNDFGIQGSWHPFSDQEGDGRTVITSPPDGACSYVEGQGMCMRAESPGGEDDNYETWGAGIGLFLNQAPGSKPLTLSPAPRCFTVVLRVQSTFSDGFTGELLPTPPEPEPGALYPLMDLHEGANEVCVDNVARSYYCASGPEDCVDPADLANGIAAVNIFAHAGPTGGAVDFCIESMTPYD